jgi:hypothetical protein
MAEPETLRLLLQKTIERNDGLVKINHETTLAIPTILGVVWTILVGFGNIDAISLFASITIGILLIWRYYAHCIDDDIASNYSRIMRFEKKLLIPKELSIYCGLIKKILRPLKSQFKNFKTIEENAIKLDENERIRFVNWLYDNKMMGYRGHRIWDHIAFILIFLFTIISLSAAFQFFFNPVHMIHPHYLMPLILIIQIAFFGFSLLIGVLLTFFIVIVFQNNTPIQKDPNSDELKRVCPSLFDEEKTN